MLSAPETAGARLPPRVAVLVVARNAAAMLEACVQSVWAQDYSHQCLELLVIDSASSDDTLACAARLQAVAPFPLRILSNPKIVLAPGWNLGVRACQSDYVLRVDAHSRLSPDYIRLCMQALVAAQAGDPSILVAGGRRLTAATGAGAWANAIATAQRSRLGMGATAYRFQTRPGLVDTLAMGIYDRRAFERVGYFDETLGRTEDNDFHARLRRSGAKLLLVPEATSTYGARTSLRELMRQMYQNGWWIGATIRRQRSFPFSIRHVVPGLWLGGLLLLAVGAAAGVIGAGWLLGAAVGVYAAAILAAAVYAGQRAFARVGLVLAAMHLSYGTGTWAALLPGTAKETRSDPKE